MNCIKDGKYTGDSCFGCPVNVDQCEIRDKVYRKRWIPVEERLPEEGQEVIVSDGNYVYLVEYDSDFGFDDVDATAWMPSPEPYRPDNEDLGHKMKE